MTDDKEWMRVKEWLTIKAAKERIRQQEAGVIETQHDVDGGRDRVKPPLKEDTA